MHPVWWQIPFGLLPSRSELYMSPTLFLSFSSVVLFPISQLFSKLKVILFRLNRWWWGSGVLSKTQHPCGVFDLWMNPDPYLEESFHAAVVLLTTSHFRKFDAKTVKRIPTAPTKFLHLFIEIDFNFTCQSRVMGRNLFNDYWAVKNCPY